MKRFTTLLFSSPRTASEAARAFALRLHFFWGLVLLLNPGLFLFPIYSTMAALAPAWAWGLASLLLWVFLLLSPPGTLLRVVAILASVVFWLDVAVAASGLEINTGTATYLVIVWTLFDGYKSTILEFFYRRAGLDEGRA